MCLKIIVFGFIALIASPGLDAIEKPSIILIYADDLGMGCIGCYGQELIKTPNMDALAKQGTLFTRVYSSKYCCPARASLLMGVHDSHSRSYTETPGGLVVKKDEQNWDLATFEEKVNAARQIQPGPNEVFMPELMKKAGYVTAQFGKLDWGFTTCHEELKRHGWDHYVGYYDHQRAHGFYPKYLWKNGRELPLPGNTLNNAGKTVENYNPQTTRERRENRDSKAIYSPEILLKETLDFMTENRDKPMFIFYSTALPHGPVDIPPAILKKKNYSHIRKEGMKQGISEWEMAAAEEYAAMVETLDDQIGQIVKHLYKLKLEKKTIVIVTSDNGHEIYYRQGNKKSQAHTPDCRGGILETTGELLDIFKGNRGKIGPNGSIVNLSNMKWSNQEGGIHVPMIAWCPGTIPAGKVSNAFIANYDHMASFAEIAGIPLPSGKDSVSYAKALFGNKKEHTRGHIVIDQSIITPDGWKLTMQQGKPLLYHLAEDPGEKNNLADQKPSKLEELKQIFTSEIKSPRKDYQCVYE